MAEKKNVPEVRFRGFDGEWEKRHLGEIATEITRVDSASQAPVMMISAASGFINQSEKYSTDNAGQSLDKYVLLKKGELAYNHGASKLRPYGSCFALGFDEARIPFVYHCFDVGDENPNFVATQLNGDKVANQLRQLVSSGARMDGLLNISFEAYETVKVFTTTKEEQNKIDEMVSNLDNLITLHQRKYDKLVTVKKSMLDKMFPKDGQMVPEIRFAGFSGAWERRKFSDFIALRKETGNQADFSTDIELENLVTNLGVVVGDISVRTQANSIFREHDTLFGRLRPYLNKWWYADREGVKSGEIWALTNTDISESIFVYSAVQTRNFIESANISSGTKMPRADWKKVANDEMYIPTQRSEQTAIGNYFLGLDSLITAQQKQLDKLKTIKKSILDKLFV